MESIDRVQCSDDYSVAVRRWRPAGPVAAQVVILHGVVSHSEWLTPFGSRLAANGIEVICPDRRGTGLNTEASGDAPSRSVLIDDVYAVRRELQRPGCPMHLAGFCWGAVYAICCAEADQSAWQSLMLIAPSVFPSADLAAKELVCGDSAEPTETPLVPLDRFTRGPAYRNYIIPDELRTRAVSRRFNTAMQAMSTFLAARWGRLQLPNLLLLAENDRLVDNAQHRRAFDVLRTHDKKLATIPGEHGLQFDSPEETSRIMAEWLVR